ncbi:universal stress protein [Kitasatospora sp. NPDC048722]|uniref:universal stress protein n=1 Tax=Kitasatospora sp. NPDC048722 TaxID=3155639 RepID=UPI0033F66CEF
MPPSVLAAVDGSPESLAAARWAADEAVRRGAGLRLLYAWPRPLHAAPGLPGVAEARGRALGMLADTADWVRANHPGLDVGTTLGAEPAPAGITAAAASAELVVLGSHEPRSPFGSVSLAVAAHAPCPVVLVRAAPGSAGPPEEVVVGLDVSDPAEPLLAFARKAARAFGVPLRAVHAWTPPAKWWSLSTGERARRTEAEEDALTDLLARGTEADVVPDVRRADAADALADASRSAGLLVLGRTGHRLGAVTRAVVHRTWCPIAVVPHG